MKRIKLLSFIFVFFVYNGFSQNILLEESPPQDTIVEKWGPNRKHHFRSFFKIGAIFGNFENSIAEIKQPASLNYAVGLRYKHKVTNCYAVGGDLTFERYSFALKQNAKKITPDTILHDFERINIDDISLGFYNRINYDKRGNFLGKYIDIGAFINWNALLTHVFKDKIAGFSYKTKVRGMDFYNLFSYGFQARIGFGKFAFYGRYRYNDIFDKKNLLELPRYTIGIEIGSK